MKHVHFNSKVSVSNEHLLYWYDIYLYFSRIDQYFIAKQFWNADIERFSRIMSPILLNHLKRINLRK